MALWLSSSWRLPLKSGAVAFSKSDAEQQPGRGRGGEKGAAVACDHRSRAGVHAEVMKAVVDAVRGVEQEQRDHGQQQGLADPVLREGEDPPIVEGLMGHPDADWRDDARDKNEDRREQSRQYAACAEQGPEDRFVRSFHVTSTAR